jgi:hypothetical protein
MAITSVEEINDGRGQTTRNETVTRTRVFLVKCDTPTEDEDAVEQASGAVTIPRMGEAHPRNSRLFVTSVNPRPNSQNGAVWTVTVTYEGYRIGGEWGENERLEPQDIPPSVTRSTMKSTEAIDTDVYGKYISNSVGEDYDPPVTADRSRLVYHISRYVAQPRDDVYSAYADAVNADAWRPYTSNIIYPPWVVRVDSVNCDLVQIKQYRLFLESWTFVVFYGMRNDQAPGGWWGHQLRVADRGKRQWAFDSDGGLTTTPILDKNGDPISEPVDLNGAGFPATTNADLTGTVWRLNQIYKALPFGQLNLG